MMRSFRKISISERFAHLAKPDADEVARQQRAAAFEDTKRFLAGKPMHDEHPQATAAAIAKAAAKARGESTEFERGPPPFEPVKTTAEGIVVQPQKSAAKREPLPKPSGTAAAIIAGGKKRRNEI